MRVPEMPSAGGFNPDKKSNLPQPSRGSVTPDDSSGRNERQSRARKPAAQVDGAPATDQTAINLPPIKRRETPPVLTPVVSIEKSDGVASGAGYSDNVATPSVPQGEDTSLGDVYQKAHDNWQSGGVAALMTTEFADKLAKQAAEEVLLDVLDNPASSTGTQTPLEKEKQPASDDQSKAPEDFHKSDRWKISDETHEILTTMAENDLSARLDAIRTSDMSDEDKGIAEADALFDHHGERVNLDAKRDGVSPWPGLPKPPKKPEGYEPPKYTAAERELLDAIDAKEREYNAEIDGMKLTKAEKWGLKFDALGRFSQEKRDALERHRSDQAFREITEGFGEPDSSDS